MATSSPAGGPTGRNSTPEASSDADRSSSSSVEDVIEGTVCIQNHHPSIGKGEHHGETHTRFPRILNFNFNFNFNFNVTLMLVLVLMLMLMLMLVLMSIFAFGGWGGSHPRVPLPSP